MSLIPNYDLTLNQKLSTLTKHIKILFTIQYILILILYNNVVFLI